jgi:cobalt-zinc-cadmium efflux system outer membrane protein
MTARVEARRAAADVELARQRLMMRMGWPCDLPIEQVIASSLPEVPCDIDVLLDDATRCRPDLLAAQAAADAAAQRARLSRWDYLRVIGVLPDANGEGQKGFEAGPGVQFTVPIFHQNQGAIARAEAELARAQRNCTTLRDTIILEVRQAHTRMLQADVEATSWRKELVPLAASAVESADKAYRDGGASMLLVLETSRQLLAAQLRLAQAEADVRRSAAELDCAVGRHVVCPRPADELLAEEAEELSH